MRAWSETVDPIGHLHFFLAVPASAGCQVIRRQNPCILLCSLPRRPRHLSDCAITAEGFKHLMSVIEESDVCPVLMQISEGLGLGTNYFEVPKIWGSPRTIASLPIWYQFGGFKEPLSIPNSVGYLPAATTLGFQMGHGH